MPTTITKLVYTFDELSDKAKEKARDWFREFVFSDNNDWDCIYEDAAIIADLMGIDLRTKQVQLMGGGTCMEPCIYFSGFSSQGDGACFEGTYSYKKGCVKAVKSYAPIDKELHKIVEGLQDIQRRHFYKIDASIKHTGRYYHSGCMSIEVDCDHCLCDNMEEDTIQLLRDFADWIYDQLRKEYEYQSSDECIDGNIRCNEYSFDEEGKRDG